MTITIMVGVRFSEGTIKGTDRKRDEVETARHHDGNRTLGGHHGNRGWRVLFPGINVSDLIGA